MLRWKLYSCVKTNVSRVILEQVALYKYNKSILRFRFRFRFRKSCKFQNKEKALDISSEEQNKRRRLFTHCRCIRFINIRQLINQANPTTFYAQAVDITNSSLAILQKIIPNHDRKITTT